MLTFKNQLWKVKAIKWWMAAEAVQHTQLSRNLGLMQWIPHLRNSLCSPGGAAVPTHAGLFLILKTLLDMNRSWSLFRIRYLIKREDFLNERWSNGGDHWQRENIPMYELEDAQWQNKTQLKWDQWRAGAWLLPFQTPKSSFCVCC